MEFRYRAIDGDRRPPPATDTPPNPIISFLSARPVPGYIREIDKEQIRNDIIVAETARRRELMAQVLHEMATSGVSLEDMQSMWINNQREPLLPNNHSLLTSPLVQKLPEDKLIVLERPESVGAKRKAEEDPTGTESAKRNAAGLCLATDLCLPCPENKGKETVSPKLSPCLGEEGGSKPSFKLWCDICKVGTFCEKVMRDHELGKKHLAATGGEAVSRKLPPSWGEEVKSKPILKFKLWCDICNVGTFCEKVMRDHELGKKHLAAIEQKKVVETELKETGKKKKALVWCEVCNIRLCSEKVMETHRLGKKHKALHEKQQRRPLAVLDTNLMKTTRMNGDPVEKGYIREIEKQQIRHDIIVAETVRGRELMAQVFQEMATSGVSETGDKLSMWINQRREILPNSNLKSTTNSAPLVSTCPYNLVTIPIVQKLPEVITPLSESNEDKLIVLKRPDSVGSKRKAEEDPTGIESAKRKASVLCLATDLYLPCPENKAKKTATSVGETFSPPCLRKEVESKQKLKFKLWCDICKVGTFCEKVMRDHELGEKHLAAIVGETVPPCLGEQVKRKRKLKFKFWCEVCNVGTFCETVMRNHELNRRHIAAIKHQNDLQEVAETGLKETGKKKVWLWCEVCNIRADSEKVMEAHRLGKRHQKRDQQMRRRAVLDTNLMTTTPMNGDDPGEKGQVLCLEN